MIFSIFQHTPVLDAGFISVGHVQYDASHSLECTALQWLREEVCEHVRCRAEGYFDLTFFYPVCYKEIEYINMAGSLGTRRFSILC